MEMFTRTLKLLLAITAQVAAVGVRRLFWIRRGLLVVMSRTTARWLMLLVATVAVLAEYFPNVPLATLVAIGVLAFINARRGKMQIGIGWLMLLSYYELYLWAIFIITPIEAFTGSRDSVGPLVASVIHCIAFTYVAWDLGANPPPPRRKRSLIREIAETHFGWLTPMPPAVPVTVPR